MISIKKILVPVDFSEPAKRAVTYGLSLAEQFNAELILAHIVPESPALLYAFPTKLPELEKDQYAKAKQAIDNVVPAEHAAKVNLQTVVKVGEVQDELLGIVRDEGIDLVVIGTHGRRSPVRWLIGSVTEHMLRRLPVPVLTVSHVEPEKQAVGIVSLKRIVYATDLSESSSTGLHYAIELASRGGQLTVMHVIDDTDRMLWGPALLTYLDRDKLTQEMQKRLEDLIKGQESADMQIETLVLEGEPFKKIIEVAEDRSMDMIVLNLQSKSVLERALLGSTAERVVRLAHTPVLSIPNADSPHG